MMDVEQSSSPHPCSQRSAVQQLPSTYVPSLNPKREVVHIGCRHGDCNCVCTCACACQCVLRATAHCLCIPIESKLGSVIAGRLGAQLPPDIQRLLRLDSAIAAQCPQQAACPLSGDTGGTPPREARPTYKRPNEEIAPPWGMASFCNAQFKKRAVQGVGNEGQCFPITVDSWRGLHGGA